MGCLLKGGGTGDVRVVQLSLAVGLSKMPHSPEFHRWFWKPNPAAVFMKTTRHRAWLGCLQLLRTFVEMMRPRNALEIEVTENAWFSAGKTWHLVLFDRRFLCCSLWKGASVFLFR